MEVESMEVGLEISNGSLRKEATLAVERRSMDYSEYV